MEQEYRPINHSGASAAASVGGGAAAGGIKAGFITAVSWIVGLTVIGAVALPAIVAGGGGSLFAGLGAIIGSAAVWGGAIGLGVAFMTLFVPTLLGAGIGALFGGSRAADRVSNERAAAAMMQAQVETFKAQAVNPYMNCVTPEEMAILAQRQRGGDTQPRTNHADMVLEQQAAPQPKQAAV